MSVRSRFDLWWENAVTRAVRRTMEVPILGRAARRIVREERYGRISQRAANPAGITKLRHPKARLPKPLPYRPITMTSTPSVPVRRSPSRRTPARRTPAKQQAPQVIHIHLPEGVLPAGHQVTIPAAQSAQQVTVPQGSQQAQAIQPSGMSVEQVAQLITRTLAAKGGSAIEIASITQNLAAQGIPPQTVQAALWGAHSAGWVKKSGKGKVAATAKSVRAGGVPTTTPRRRAG